jgi:hypothetical protein
MLGALAETDEGDVRPFPRRHRAHVFNLNLARDHLVPERGDDRGDERQAILALVRDQDTQVLGLARAQLGPAAAKPTTLRRRLAGSNLRSLRVKRRPKPLASRAPTPVEGSQCYGGTVRPSPSADNFFRLQHLAGVVRDSMVAPKRKRQEPPMSFSSPNRSSGLSPCTDERRRND